MTKGLTSGRYLLFIDILGFSELVESRSVEEVYEVVSHALSAFDHWEEQNGDFKTIYFSDSFIFYQDPEGYGDWAFLDVYAIGGMVLSALLAKGIAARGAISFGEFVVRIDPVGKRQVYFGRALVEAYRAEQQEPWLGIVILKSAWSLYESMNPGVVAVYESEGIWRLRREDQVLLLNPLIKLRSYYFDDQIRERDRPCLEWSTPEFLNDLLAFKFIRDQSQEFLQQGDFTGKVAIKYHTTLKFLRSVHGEEISEWANRIFDESKL